MTTSVSPRISALRPRFAIPGGRVSLDGGPFSLDVSVRPVLRVGGSDARLAFASSSTVAFIVPQDAPAGIQPVRGDIAPGETVFLEVAEVVATGIHAVDSPAVDGDGTIYVTCSGSRGQQTPVSVYRIGETGVREVFATGITNATSLAFDQHGRLHVTSRFDGTVSRLDVDGRVEVVATDLGVATGLAFAPDGTMYVGDRTGTVLKVTPGEDARPHATLPASVAAFHLAVASDGRALYATAPTLAPVDSVFRIDQDGRVSVVATGFGRPQGLAASPGGQLFVVDALAGASGVFRVDENGGAELVVAGPLVGLAFDRSGGLVLTSNDAVYRLPGFTA